MHGAQRCAPTEEGCSPAAGQDSLHRSWLRAPAKTDKLYTLNWVTVLFLGFSL